jgi:bifunctional enzyme CysN/CysC
MNAVQDVDAHLAQHERRELLRFVAVGSVDDGKSTLIGRLLHDTHGIYDDQLAAVERASKRRGSAGGKLDLSLLTDGLKAEREQGITIDVAYRYFSTERRKFIIADTPGHVQYTRNMATGASTADVALILIDARHGVMQQSRRHAYIASLLGIPHLLVCVNKMDLVDFDPVRFEAIRRDFETFSRRMRFSSVRFVPISAVDGDNVVHKSDKTPWYPGETVLSFLENVSLVGDRDAESFRYPVQYVLRPDLTYRGFSGQIASGVVRRGDEIAVLPSGRRSRVAAIDTFDGSLDEAFAPMSVTLRLDDEIDISRGDMICHPGDEPFVCRRFDAHVVWMSETALDPARSYLLKHTTRMVRASVEAVGGKLDMDSLEEITAERLELNDVGRLSIVCNQPLYVDRYRKNRLLGAFVLIDALTNDTVGAGMIDEPREETTSRVAGRRSSPIGAEERRKRFGHGACVVTFTGDPTPAQLALTDRLERALFDRGVVCSVVDVRGLDDGTRSPELVADVAAHGFESGLVTILASALPRVAEREAISARFSASSILVIGQGGDVELDPADPQAVAAVIAALERRGVL